MSTRQVLKPIAFDRMLAPPQSSIRRAEMAGHSVAMAKVGYQRHHPHSRVDFDTAPGLPFRFRFLLIGDECLRLRSDRVDGRLTAFVTSTGRSVLAWTHDGDVVVDPGTPRSLRMSPGTPMMLPTGRPFSLTAGPGTINSIDLAADLTPSRTDGIGQPASPAVSVPPNRLPALRSAIKSVTPGLLNEQLPSETRSALVRLVASAVTDALPASEPAEQTRLARAQAFIRGRSGDSITLSDISSAIGVSERTLQQDFRDAGLPAPMQYLHRVRLDNVRQLLLSAAPNFTIRDIARHGGFHHLGRFSASYHEQFGEYPSDTRRRANRAR